MILPTSVSAMTRPISLLAVWLMLGTSGISAQEAPRGPAAADTTLDGRMHAFLEAVRDGNTITAFFPRRGDWEWVQSLGGRRGVRRVVTWRIPAAETGRMIREGGPACELFQAAGGDVGPVVGSFPDRVHDDGWRRAGGTRFVPPGASARSPIFVRWRREDGAWVVDAFGDEQPYRLPLLGRPVEMISRDTALVREGLGYAADADWYRRNEPMHLDGWWYVKYGLPLRLSDREQIHLVRIGTRGPVSLYMETAMNDIPIAGMLYAPVSPGEFQPYMAFGRAPCR